MRLFQESMNIHFAHTAIRVSLIVLSLASHTVVAKTQTLYADEVEWYGQSLTAHQVIDSEAVFVNKNKGYQK